jgi:polysaccharide biosynthesis/export protein
MASDSRVMAMKRTSCVLLILLLVIGAVPVLAWQQSGRAVVEDKQQPAKPVVVDKEEKDSDTKKAEEAKTDPLREAEVAAPVDPNSYVIGPEDVIKIQVWREGELSGVHAVRPDGKITLPLIGDIQAGGQTPDQLKQAVVKGLSEVVVNPLVYIAVVQVNSKRYYITGEVNKTGQFQMITPITVMEALSLAGGFREFANTKKVLIWRKGKLIRFNYKEVLEGKNLEQNILIEPGDQIVVP